MVKPQNNRYFDGRKGCEQGTLIEAVQNMSFIYDTRVEVNTIVTQWYLLKQILRNGLKFFNKGKVVQPNFFAMLPEILRMFDSSKIACTDEVKLHKRTRGINCVQRCLRKCQTTN